MAITIETRGFGLFRVDGEFRAALAAVKAFRGREWDAATKMWTNLPDGAPEALRRVGFRVVDLHAQQVVLAEQAMAEDDDVGAKASGFGIGELGRIPADREPTQVKKLGGCCHYCGLPVSGKTGFFGEMVCDECR